MRNRILCLLAAGVLALVALVIGSAPAQAVGWSGQRCDSVTLDGKVCVQVHTYWDGAKVRIDTVQLCAYKDPNQTQAGHFRSTKNSTINTNLSGAFLNEATPGAGCAYTNWTSQKLPNQSCYAVDGRMDVTAFSDPLYHIVGNLSGGPC